MLESLNPEWLLRLPLLGDLLELPIPDNQTTAAFEPQLRRAALITLTTEIIQAAARPRRWSSWLRMPSGSTKRHSIC